MASHDDNKDSKSKYTLVINDQSVELNATGEFMSGVFGFDIIQDNIEITDSEGKEYLPEVFENTSGKYTIICSEYGQDYNPYIIKTDSKDYLDGLVYGLDLMKLPHQIFNVDEHTCDDNLAITGIVSISIDDEKVDPKTLYPKWTIVDINNYDEDSNTWTSEENEIPSKPVVSDESDGNPDDDQ